MVNQISKLAALRISFVFFVLKKSACDTTTIRISETTLDTKMTPVYTFGVQAQRIRECLMLRTLIGLAAVWVFAGGFGGSSSSACENGLSPQRDCKPCKRPDGSLNHSPNITGLVLDKTQLRLEPNPPGQPVENADRSPDMIVNVATNAEDAENDVLDYYYTISGGRIVGTGSNVTWDLTGVPPGTYTITAKVDDSCGICGKTMTKGVMIIGKTPIVEARATPLATKPATVAKTSAPTTAKAATSVVIARPTPTATTRTPASTTGSPTVPCSCPKIMIADPEKSDSDLIFTTKIFDLASTNRLTYIWTITGGGVVSQDGRSIRIKPGVLGGSVNVTVNGLEPKCSCPNTAHMKF
jgi:hypothetical protein